MAAYVRELGRRIAERRRARGLTQEGLAERIRVNVKTIQAVEQGRSEPELRTMRRIAAELGVSLDALLGSPRRSADAIIDEITKRLRLLSPMLLDHVAAIVAALAERPTGGRRKRSTRSP